VIDPRLDGTLGVRYRGNSLNYQEVAAAERPGALPPDPGV
jgi:hypothetical protein